MKTWRRASHRLVCGATEGCWIASGDAYLELQIGAMHRTLRRCAQHAGEAPKDIQEPAMPAPKPKTPSTAAPLRWLATQAKQKVQRMTPRGDFDARAAQARNDT